MMSIVRRNIVERSREISAGHRSDGVRWFIIFSVAGKSRDVILLFPRASLLST